MSKSCPSLASESKAWETGFELLKCIDFIGSCVAHRLLQSYNPNLLNEVRLHVMSSQKRYLILRIKITNENCITNIEYQVSSFAVKV
ncbi:hypothetical protein HanXRQr2_Chr01g0040121 [Helianthus annuus]|uniref:Uncharacterized protein n=1 Tax=Helianthus annuus TaxID=4232 RepID=A0A9K3JZQ9_HELAN|nr:hypothetical protein HanXRQr2_Chr01g0040121 [Helianthus annuus]